LSAAALAATETRLPPHLRERAQRLLDDQQRIDHGPETGQT
jgi:hypothetical protein